MRPDTQRKPCSHLLQEWKINVWSETLRGIIKDAVKKMCSETLVQSEPKHWRQFQAKRIVAPMGEDILGEKNKNSRKWMNT